MYRVFLKGFFKNVFLIIFQNYVNAELNKSEMPMTWKEFNKTERYQQKQNIIRKNRILKRLKALQNIATIFKINSIDSLFSFVFVCRDSRICSRSLLISSAIMAMFLTRIFRILDLEIQWVLRCKAMELESLRCIVSRLERVVVIRPTYVLFLLETQYSKGHLNIYTTFVLLKVQWRGKSYWK